MFSDTRILIDKPAGLSSFGVVARVRGQLSRRLGRKVKVGHTGTLDPFATGLMILLVGRECKNAAHYSKLDKVYEALICLGQTSSTGDPEGQIVPASDTKPNLREVEDALDGFIGEITQRPPIYSAIKINGRRAYQLAREVKEVDMPTRRVMIYDIELLDYQYPNLKIRAKVSSGTYIRTLAQDIGEKLGTGAYCQTLRRLEVGGFDVKDAHTLDELCSD